MVRVTRWKKLLAPVLTFGLVISMASCAANTGESAVSSQAASEAPESAVSSQAASEASSAAEAAETSLAPLDAAAWRYNADDDVYYQIGARYCASPADADYETLAVFVPGAYFTAADNGDGTYTCQIDESGQVGGYTAGTAPIVMPINTPGYSAQAALTEYSSSASAHTGEGFVYVHAGCRGRDSGAPAGVTDLKAAIRYLRYSAETLAGDVERIFVFGMSGGGAQSALVGATGDAPEYEPYLTAIGAVEGVSDAVLGSMDWCPITNLDAADAAYEWMMGGTRSGLSDEERRISDLLAASYADTINAMGLVDGDGNALTLEASDEGTDQAGSYYDYLKGVIETSLNHFLSDTEFPYDASSSGSGGMGGMGGGFGGGFGGGEGGPPDGDFDGSMPEGGPDFGDTAFGPRGRGDLPARGDFPEDLPGELGAVNESEPPQIGLMTDGDDMANAEANDDITRNGASGGLSLSGTYEAAQEYIDALNADGEWVVYDEETNTASITSVADFAAALKNASKNLGAFDQLDKGQGENQLFGLDGESGHFDETLAGILESVGSDYAADYAEDLAKTDSQGNTPAQRLQMYTPLYYLLESQAGYGESQVAKYWRIRTGINQGDTSLTTEVNLALALEAFDGVESVDFETVWGQGHTQAERSGSASENFIQWVKDCTQ